VWGVSSLVGKDASIKGFADLKGKRVAIPFPGSPLDFQTRALLAFEKIDPDRDVTFVYGPVAQGLQRLQAGQVDAVAIPEPQATAVVKQQGLARLAVYAQAWSRVTGGDPMSPQVSLFSTSAWVDGHRGLVADVLAAWDTAARAVSAAPADTAAAFAGALAVDAAVLEEAVRNTLLAVPAPAENRARVLAYYQAVARYLPAGPRPLDERFFFLP
jgi:ABC-type nitrate/sulfonate/bicarbonate transport system substrate-binding protein